MSAGATSGDDARMNITYMFAKQIRILGSRLGTMSDTTRRRAASERGPLPAARRPQPALDELAEAHRLMDEGQLIGKAIVKP